MVEYIDELSKYLPVDFGNVENNEFKEYYKKSYIDNYESENYQLSYLSFHILFMTIIYKHFWFLKNYSYAQVEPLLRNNGKYRNLDNVFSIFEINESDAIRDILARVSFDSNESKKVVELVDVRNSCVHACGKIYYKEQTEMENELIKAIAQEEKIFNKIKECIRKVFVEAVHEYFESPNFDNTLSIDEARKWTVQMMLSPAELIYLMETNESDVLIDYNDPTYKISFYIILETYRNIVIDKFLYYDDLEDYLVLLKEYVKTLTMEQFNSISMFLEYEINELHEKYSTISYSDFISGL